MLALYIMLCRLYCVLSEGRLPGTQEHDEWRISFLKEYGTLGNGQYIYVLLYVNSL
jgi:hypothetical protein